MSLFMPVNLICPACEALITMDAVGSVNADRRPDLREDILENRFQDVTCGSCGESFRLQPNFNYLDAGRGQWIASMPADRMAEHARIADEVTDLFDRSYGRNAPVAARAVGDDLTVRLTFGWPALREKLLARAHDLDDVVLEMLKLDLMRRLPSAPLTARTDLRLVGVSDDLLQFVWFDAETEEGYQEVAVRRALYDEIVQAADAWGGIRARLEDGVFVDVKKLILGDEIAA